MSPTHTGDVSVELTRTIPAPAEREESLLTVTLREAEPGATALTLVHARLTDVEGVDEGWGEALDRLEALYEEEGR